MVKKLIKNIYLGLILIFLYSPIIVLMVFSFNNSKSTSVWSGFTTQWYIELFKDKMIIKSLYYTLTTAITSTSISTLVGGISAFGIFYMGTYKKRVMLNINNLPVLNPDIVTGVAMMSLFVFIKNLTGLNFGFLTLLIAHITFSIPFVMLSILPKLKQMPKDIWDSAMDLGAKPYIAFIKVILPEIKPGIVPSVQAPAARSGSQPHSPSPASSSLVNIASSGQMRSQNLQCTQDISLPFTTTG